MKNPLQLIKPALHAVIIGLCLTSVALAQSATANIRGEAKPGATAVIHNTDTGFTREIKVDDEGRYSLRNLPTGNFSVTIKNPDGSMEEPKFVRLQVGSTARVK